MWLKLALSRRRAPAGRRCCPRSRTAKHKLFLEPLEERNLLSGWGVTPSLVALGEAGPRPIPLLAAVLPLTGTSALSGPDVYLNFPGPATKPPPFGNDPSAITDFRGSYGGAAVFGDGTDGQGNTLYWAADVRFMKGTYRGLDGELHKGAFVEV
jgi:hypothetical protein